MNDWLGAVALRWAPVGGVAALVMAVSVSLASTPDSLAPVVPQAAEQWAPAFTQHREPIAPDALGRGRVAECATCHYEVSLQWASSAHAFASFNNPYYRVSVELNRDAAGFEASRFCAGCHDPALLVTGAMDGPIAPDDPAAHAGITCVACHSIDDASNDGNGSYHLAMAPIVMPAEGDPDTLAAHRARLADTTLRTNALCVSCHRGFVGDGTGNPHFFFGMNDAADWEGSAYAGTGIERLDDPVEAADCAGCHMPSEAGVRSHRFPGAQTALAQRRVDTPQLLASQELLRSSATLAFGAVTAPDGTRWLDPDEADPSATEWVFDLVVRNVGAGHRFPAGTLDLQDTWLEVTLTDADGVVVARAGTDHALSGWDQNAHVLRAFSVDEEGAEVPFHVISQIRTTAWNHTIPARDAAVVQYRWAPEAGLAEITYPLTLDARLRHRRHHLTFARRVCEESTQGTGAEFVSAAARLNGELLDPCLEQPITEVAALSFQVGPGARNRLTRPEWRQQYEHALGLSHGVQERLAEAYPSLRAAWRQLQVEGSDRERAMALVLWAEIDGMLGRTDSALERLDLAAAEWRHHPTIAFRRGEALAQVWRWSEAAAAYQEAALGMPSSELAWERLAVALVSDGQFEQAGAAVQTGLQLNPRNVSLLRSQYLALRGLGASAAAVSVAQAAYLEHRVDDDAPGMRAACERLYPDCAARRAPVPVYELLAGEP